EEVRRTEAAAFFAPGEAVLGFRVVVFVAFRCLEACTGVQAPEIEGQRKHCLFCSLPFPVIIHLFFNCVTSSGQLAREDYLELRQEASDLQDYSNAKLDRVTRYLGVLADKTRKLDQAAFETEARISPLINEKKKLFNDLLTAKGSVKVFCRTRPLFEDEGPSVVEYPDDFTIRIPTGDDNVANLKKDFEFDRVYGPHVGQAELFGAVQPFVQSALDGYNVSIFAYGQTGSGKTHTLEGSSHDRGLYARSFEELFDLSNSDTTSTSRFEFSVSVFEIYNEQIRDLLSEPRNGFPKIQIGSSDSLINLVQEKVDNPLDFSRVLRVAFQNRGNDLLKFNFSHLYVFFFVPLISRPWLCFSRDSDLEKHSVLLCVKRLQILCVVIQLHVLTVYVCICRLGDVLSSLTSKKEFIPYENSMLTKVLSDSLGGSAKTLMIVNVCPNLSNLSETLSSLNFSARARNAVLSLGNRDTIKKWRDVVSSADLFLILTTGSDVLANDARKELYDKEKEINDLKQEVLALRKALKDANDQCVLLFNEVQKAWKVSFTLHLHSLVGAVRKHHAAEKHKIEKDQNAQLRNQVALLLQLEQDHKLQIQQRDSTVQTLQAKLKSIESQLNEALHARELGSDSRSVAQPIPKAAGDAMDSIAVTKKLEEELLKRDALIERLHEENEKLFDRLTEKTNLVGSPQVSSPLPKGPVNVQARDFGRTDSNNNGRPAKVSPSPLAQDNNQGTIALVKSGSEQVKTTPAGEYLTAALNEFDPEQYDSLAAISDGANKLLMLDAYYHFHCTVLAAVIKAGASREHEILAEIRDAVFSFIRKMEPKRVMDTMLVSRVRILYIRSLLSRSPELQSIKVSPVERFLEKTNTGHSRSSSRGSSPGRSPLHYDPSRNSLVGEQIQGFKVNIKPEKKSKLSAVVLKMRGIDQHFGSNVGNKALAALFVHTPAGELQRQIRSWLAENFDFLSVTGGDAVGGTAGQLELLSTAIMDGWMAGLGAALPPSTDALGQLLSEYSKRVYSSQLQHLKDIAGTLATEQAEDPAQVAKLRSALESVDHKRRKILQQMRSDAALLTLQGDGSPVKNPSTAAEDARLASLISLDGLLKQVKDIIRQSSRMPSLLDVDHPCAQRHIADARRLIEFNTGSTTPFIIKCGANSNSELVIKADARVQEPKGGEIVRVVPKPTVLENMGLEEMKQVFSQLPEALSLLALARTADGTGSILEAVQDFGHEGSALRDLVGELEKGGVLKDRTNGGGSYADAVKGIEKGAHKTCVRIPPSGNGWLFRSAVAKLHKQIPADVFRKEVQSHENRKVTIMDDVSMVEDSLAVKSPVQFGNQRDEEDEDDHVSDSKGEKVNEAEVESEKGDPQQGLINDLGAEVTHVLNIGAAHSPKAADLILIEQRITEDLEGAGDSWVPDSYVSSPMETSSLGPGQGPIQEAQGNLVLAQPGGEATNSSGDIIPSQGILLPYSQSNLRVSQTHGINLMVDLNSAGVRRRRRRLLTEMYDSQEQFSEGQGEEDQVGSPHSEPYDGEALSPSKEVQATLAVGLSLNLQFKGNEERLLRKMME
ncbi:hypothetical protein C3L33_17632, partial [Rhododendron williamsianum]